MHWLLHLLVDAALVAGLAAAYCAYQEHRRKQSEYARVQLYEDADKPCALPPVSSCTSSRTRLCALPAACTLYPPALHPPALHPPAAARCQRLTSERVHPPHARLRRPSASARGSST